MSSHEQERLAALRSYRVLDTPRQPSFDRVVQLAADLFEVPMAAISLIDTDRQWFKAEIGLNTSQTPRDWAFCSHTIARTDGLLVIEDAAQDRRFRDNPLVTGDPHIRFYAGAALTSAGGHNLGALCVIGPKPLHPSKTMLAQLEILAKLAVGELEIARTQAINTEKNQLLELAEHMSGVGHWRYELESGTVTWSPEVYRIHGVTPESFDPGVEESMAFYSPHDQQDIQAGLAAAIATGEGYESKRHMTGRDGVERIVATKAVCERNNLGKVIALFGVFQDVTRHVRALDAANAAAAVKAEFLANMSHELRTPLTGIIGFSELLRARPGLDDVAAGYVDRVLNGSHALLATVNDILDFSKLEAGQVELKPRPIPARRLFADMVDLLASQADAKGIRLQLNIADTVPETLILDPDRMRQILLNLVGNAVKFTARGGVDIGVEYQPTQKLQLTVSDSGPGIKPEQIGRLFQRFSQVDGSLSRAHGGTGLGLAICKGLVDTMGGEISVDSVFGAGSTFRVTIPCAGAGPAQAAQTSPAQTADLGAYRLRVVDDNPANHALVTASLRPTGIELTLASDGAQAVEYAARTPFDAILMDLHMPVMDGYGAVQAIRKTAGPNQAITIMAFTADSDGSLARQLRDLGFDGIVAKPVLPSELIRTLTRILTDEQTQYPSQRMAHHA